MSAFEYSEWDGSQEFQPLDAESAFDKLADFLLDHGEQILRHLERLDPDQPDWLRHLIKEGYVEVDESGQFSMTPKGIKRMEGRALDELFRSEERRVGKECRL